MLGLCIDPIDHFTTQEDTVDRYGDKVPGKEIRYTVHGASLQSVTAGIEIRNRQLANVVQLWLYLPADYPHKIKRTDKFLIGDVYYQPLDRPDATQVSSFTGRKARIGFQVEKLV